jgi:pimeloyl-ACP methyl ester carboxylesterase
VALVTPVLQVPGARLHVEVQGFGPVLLLIPGGAGDAGAFAGIAPLLVGSYTVVAYDPRGTSRSPLHGPPADITVATQADDAHRLLAAFGSGPAAVFGNSAGAVTALELVTRHPEQVHTLVAHEPPVTELLPDGAHHRRRNDELREIHRDHGPLAALTRFLADTGMGDGMPAPPSPHDPREQAALGRMMSNLDMFFAHVVGPVVHYRPDVEALRAASTRIVVAGGTESSGRTPWRAAEALATALGTPLVPLPGDHSGFVGRPDEFAAALRPLLSERTRSSG